MEPEIKRAKKTTNAFQLLKEGSIQISLIKKCKEEQVEGILAKETLKVIFLTFLKKFKFY